MNHFARIAEQFPARGLDAMLVTSEAGEFYAAGFHGEGVAVITPGQTWYYTDSRYIEAAQAIQGAEIGMIRTGQSYRGLVGELVAAHHIRTLGFEDEGMSVADYKLWVRDVKADFVPASDLLTQLRMVKDAGELAAMRQAQKVTDEAFAEILNFIRPGVAECEIAARLTYLMAGKGAQRNSFDPIVACGANGSKPHAIPGKDLIQKGQFVTMDFGCVVEGYCSDMTRTVAVGSVTEEMRQVYDTVLRAQKAGIDAARAGAVGRAVDGAARDIIEQAGYGPYFGHSFGHGVGVEIHEGPNATPSNDKPLPAGAVISAEPGIYLPGRLGVRIEDVLYLTEDGCQNLTLAPKDLIIL